MLGEKSCPRPSSMKRKLPLMVIQQLETYHMYNIYNKVLVDWGGGMGGRSFCLVINCRAVNNTTTTATTRIIVEGGISGKGQGQAGT